MSQLCILEPETRPDGIFAAHYRVVQQVRNHNMIAAIGFHGAMPDGSKGKAHGRYISAQAAYWMTYLNALCIVIDFRDLEYKWGDSMLGVFQTLDQYFRDYWKDGGIALPIKILASSKSSGLYSLIDNRDMFFQTWIKPSKPATVRSNTG